MTEQIVLVMELMLPFLSCAERQVTMVCVAARALVDSGPAFTCSLRKSKAGSAVGGCVECRNHCRRFCRVKEVVELLQRFMYNCMLLPKSEENKQEAAPCEWNTARILAKARKFPSPRQIVEMAGRLNALLDVEGKNREISNREICPIRLSILICSFLASAVETTGEYSIKNKYHIRRCLKLAVAIHTYFFAA